MGWNYRVVRRKWGEDSTYGIHEAYGDHARKPHSITVDPVAPVGDSVAELREAYRMMSEAFDAPILESDAFDAPVDGIPLDDAHAGEVG